MRGQNIFDALLRGANISRASIVFDSIIMGQIISCKNDTKIMLFVRVMVISCYMSISANDRPAPCTVNKLCSKMISCEIRFPRITKHN